MVRSTRWWITALCLGLLATSALAQDKNAAKAAYRRGTQHYNLNEIDKALEAFKEAYRAYEDPGLLFNIGQCQRRLGQHEEAALSFRAYLRELPNAPNRDEVQQLVERLNEQIARDKQRKAEEEAAAKAKANPPVEAPPAAPLISAPPTAIAALPKPLHKRWWLWAAVGGVVVVGVALGVGLALGLPPKDTYPTLDGMNNGTYRF